MESEELVWSEIRTQFQSGADLNGREPERKRGRQGYKVVDIGAPVKNRGEGPKGKIERRQQSRDNRSLGGDKDDHRGRPRNAKTMGGR